MDEAISGNQVGANPPLKPSMRTMKREGNFYASIFSPSSTNTAVFLLRSFDDLCAKSFLMSAIFLYCFETLTLAYFQ